MSVETLEILSFVFFIVSIIFFITAVILFFLLKIPKLFREITGIEANRHIKKYDFKTPKGESGHLKSSGKKMKMSNIMTHSGILKEPYAESPETDDLKRKNVNNISAETTALASSISNNNNMNLPEKKLPVIEPQKKFMIIREFEFTSSTEIVE